MKNAGDKKEKKIDALDSIKFKHFCASKDTIETAERQQAGREDISASHIFDKRLASTPYRVVLKLNNKSKNTQQCNCFAIYLFTLLKNFKHLHGIFQCTNCFS